MGKAGNPKFRTSSSAAVMFLENSSQNEKKIPCSPILGHFSWLMIKLCQSHCLSPSIMYKNEAFCKVDVNLIKIDYTTFTNFSMKYLVMCMVYTDDGGIK